MSILDDYNKEKNKLKTKKKPDEFLQEYYEERNRIRAQKNYVWEDPNLAPVEEPEEERTWFTKGAYEDGKQKGDLWKTILGTLGDVGQNIGAGIIGMGEQALDAAAYLAPLLTQGQYYQTGGEYRPVEEQQMFNTSIEQTKQANAGFIQKDLYDEEAIAKKIIKVDEGNSVLGEKSDALVQSGGQLLGTIGLSAAGVPWFLTTGATSFGSQAEVALNEGASYEQAGVSAAVSAGAEILSEKLSGGIKFGGKTLDDVLLKPLTEKIANKAVKTLVNLGVDAVGEGAEEIVSQVMSNLGTAIYKDESVKELLFSEQAVDEYLESFIGGMVLGGVGSGVQAVANSNRIQLTENEQKVVDHEYEKRTEGKKLTTKQQNDIRKEVVRDLQRGYISTDTIEEVLGGETYKTYKNTVDSEDALRKEYDELGKKKAPTLAEQTRYKELHEQMKGMDTSKRDNLKTQLGNEVMSLVKGERLAESYNERARRGQAFKADVSKYDAKQQATIQKAIDSGILNNTNRTHEFVDMIAKITADKGVSFDFTNNERLKESGFAVDGKAVNGYVTKDGITLNIDSAKSLNSVVGHEITHVLEGTELYNALQSAVVEYAKTKGQYDKRLASLTKLYEGVKDADVNSELVADLVGDYLFTDADFVRNLSVNHRNVFQKIFDEIKYLCKVATAGSKEARELEKVKKAFEDAYRATKPTETKTETKKTETQKTPVNEAYGTVENILGMTRINNTLANEIIHNADVAKAFTDITGVELTGTTEQKRQLIRDTVKEWQNRVAENETIAQEDAEQANLEESGYRSYIIGMFARGATVPEAQEILRNPEMKAEWEALTGKKLPENYKSAIKMIRQTKRNPMRLNQTKYSLTETDQTYLDAVNRGDTETAQMMVDEAAQAAGYDTGYIVYRADSAAYNTLLKGSELDTEDEYNDDHGNLGDGLYFTPSLPYAERFKGKNGVLRKFYLKTDAADLSDPEVRSLRKAILDEIREEFGDFSRDELYSTLLERLEKDGIKAMGVGGFSGGAEEIAVQESWQAKLADPVTYDDNGNVIPLSQRFNSENPDIRYSLTDAQQEYTTESEVQFSLSNDTAYMDKAIEANNASMTVDSKIMEEAKALRGKIAARMNEIKDRGLVALPEDVEGNTYIANSSYDGTEENTTICPRSLASEAFVDAVSEYLGRPLTVEEQIYISQDLQGRTLTPECLYCYVATDRKAYRAFLGEWVKQRDAVIEKLKANPNADLSRSGAMYTEFRNGRKDTTQMYDRFKMWTDAYKNGKPMIDASHLANINKLMGDINSEFGAELKPQIVDAMKYAQSASWAKKRINYVAYNGHILKWKQNRINKLNSHYGLRMYSFSDFHPAFVLENMQMITDASVRGLKMLGYTKDTDFVEIFAPTGMNINVSTFGFESSGQVFENNIIGANWDSAKTLREQYPNVGVTFVATNDTLVEWALEQDWIDVVIPYHLVRTGAEVAKALNYTNYTSESSDTKTADWKKGDAKYIAPTEHNNDKATYLAALEKNHLKPRFERFLNNPNYMKLVNECRRPASESKPVQPVFNEDAAMKALAKLEANGYYQPIGGSVDRMYEIAAEVAETMTQELAPTMSLSGLDEQYAPVNSSDVFGSDIALDAPVREDAPVSQTTAQTKPPVSKTNDIAPVREEPARVLTEEPKVEKKSGAWSMFKDNFVDRGTIFETMSLKSGNRELQAKWKSIGRAESSAQWFMEHGNDKTGSLKSIRDAVEKSGKTQKFYDYLHHMHNVDRMAQKKPVFGIEVTADMSRAEAAKLEKANPEFKQWAEAVYSYMDTLLEMEVENGIITQDAADLWAKMYPHYVPIRRNGDDTLDKKPIKDTKRTGVNAPIKKATGGSRNILPLFDTMALRTEQTFKAIAKNSFGVELKNMLGTTIENEAVDIDDAIDSVEADVIQPGANGRNPTFTVFENGEKVTFEITEEMYDTMKPKSKAMAYTNKALNTANNIRRGLLTEYNPAFMLTNPIKDTQDVLMNSQHPARTYANYPKAMAELWGKGKYYQEYMEHGGEQNTYFDNESKTFAKEKSGLSKVVGFPFEKISQVNNFIERIPRMAEYIASRKQGRSIDVSMLDAARVTTDFSAGGDVVKFANRNGFTFLNASVQGAVQQVRNVREAKNAGLKGWVKLAAKIAAAGLPEMLLNHLLWDDDEDYAELSDYVKQNYYIVAKYGDGKFVRIPKGRTAAVIQSAFTQMRNLITGDDEADFEAFAELAISNLAPSNPLENNLIAPIVQAVNNETWYGDELVPTRLQDLPAAEQYDETTDAISKWLGEKTNISPYKLNYLLDQYSGGVGDTFLPMMTQEAERGNDTFMGNMIAPISDKFTTDGVLKNQNVSDFYTKKDELAVNANATGATDEDVLMSKYMNSVNADLAKLYAEKREIQNSDLPNAEKYEAVRDVQKQIVELTEEGLNTYGTVTFDNAYREGGKYAKVGDRVYKLNKDGEWAKLSDEQVTKYEVTKAAGNAPYADDGKNYYRWYKPEGKAAYWDKMTEDQVTKYLTTRNANGHYATNGTVHYRLDEGGDPKNISDWTKISDKELARQKEVTSKLGITPDEYWSKTEKTVFPMYEGEYEYAYDNPENYAVAKAVGGYDAYRGYSNELYNIKADKDANGKSVSGSRKKKVSEYINNLDADYYTKIILWKSEYPSDDSYNMEIIEHLNSRDDISYEDMVNILTELGFKVSEDGTISW